ncbi:MAG: DUF6159 family protein [Pseudomonadota bacterium]
MGIATSLRRADLITKHSWRVLWHNRDLMVLPIASAGTIGVVALVFAAGIFGMDALFGDPDDRGGAANALFLLYGFCLYLSVYTAANVFNVALIYAVMGRLEGAPRSAGEGLRFALTLLPQILVWSAICATIGLLLRAIGSRLGSIGEILFGLAQVAWAMATFFVLPVLVAERAGTLDAIDRSSMIMQRKWGTSVAADFGVAFLIYIALAVAIMAIIVASDVMPTGYYYPSIVVVGAVLGCFILILTTLGTVLRTALYRYATTGEVPDDYDPDRFQSAFRSE